MYHARHHRAHEGTPAGRLGQLCRQGPQLGAPLLGFPLQLVEEPFDRGRVGRIDGAVVDPVVDGVGLHLDEATAFDHRRRVRCTQIADD